jgi:hypothetical protein
MTRRSGSDRYLRRPRATIDGSAASRLAAVRVRTFELRLIGLVLAGCWTFAALIVLVRYRPGGPIDVAVGIVALAPALVALAGVAWPPVARGDRAFAAMVCLAAGCLLVLVPSVADVNGQLGGGGAQTLLPSVEAAYPWVLGLIGTSLFTGFGIARKRMGEAAMRRHRLVRGIILAALLAAGSGLVFTAVAMGNELALQDRVASSSRFGPTGVDLEPPDCDGPMDIGTSATIAIRFVATVDGRSIGSIDIAGERAIADTRWLAYVASIRELGFHGATTIGSSNWVRLPLTGWRRATAAEVGDDDLDLNAFRTALSTPARAAAESRGVALIEGARARECQIQIDGPTFRAAFPQVEWLVGSADLAHWRGQLNYWVFLDAEIGRIQGRVNGDAADIQAGALQATIEVDLTATDRDRQIVINAPAP